MSKKFPIYCFKITLSHISPPIWRRVEVSADITLYHLAATIICVMGWHGGHLHQFRVGEEYYGIPLEAIRDPKHPEHENMREWAGEDFDPEKFDLKQLADLADDVKDLEKDWDDQFE